MRNFSILLLIAFFLTQGTPAWSGSDTDVFRNGLPPGFSMIKHGKVGRETGRIGHYVVLSNNPQKTMALVVDTYPADRPMEKKSPLESHDYVALTDYLFRHFVGLGNYRINNERDQWVELDVYDYPANWLRVKFSDNFEESDLVFRVDYPRGRQVIFLLGRPATGSYQDCPAFRQDYFAMERLGKVLVEHGQFMDQALPPSLKNKRVAQYFKTLLKSHHRKHCFDDTTKPE